jgi:beta-1,4-mannosyltransferase
VPPDIKPPLTLASWPYKRSDCNYIIQLYAHLLNVADAQIDICEFRVGRFWRPKADVLHLHWPEIALDAPSNLGSAMKAIVVLLDVLSMKLRGTRVVFTRHDLMSHKQSHPRAERRFVRLIEYMTDGFIHLTEKSVEHFEAAGTPDRPTAIIAQGLNEPSGSAAEKTAAKEELGLPPGLTFGVLGRLESYKNVVPVIEEFPPDLGAHLLVAGQPIDDQYRAELDAVGAAPHVTMVLRRLDRAEFDLCLAACDVVVLAHSNHLNSGVALEALAARARLAASESPAMVELADQAGRDWVKMIQAPPTESGLAAAIEWARVRPENDLDLPFTWSDVATQTWEFYKMVTDR